MGSDTGITELGIDELMPGSLAERFASGSAVVVIKGDPELLRVRQTLLQNPEEQLPWRAPLIDIARNHWDGRSLAGTIGDMCYFTPGRLAYIARKIELVRESGTGEIRCMPESFHQGNGSFSVAPTTQELCWSITDRIMQALVPRTATQPSYRVVVHRLMYQDRNEDNDQLYALAKNMVGRWAQLGHKIDARRELARGPLSPAGVSDLFAILGLIPQLRGGLDKLNGKFAKRDRLREVGGGTKTVIGKPHYDGRYFSALCGSRNAIATEIFVDGRWIELPIGDDSMAVLPGLMARSAFGLQPVLHRVLHDGDKDASPAANLPPSVTLLFGTR